ncbi:MAG: hypothetical protein WED05_12255 [Candidatus Atabeyarchaeum deiterrae]
MHRMTMRSRVSDLYQEGSRFISSCAHILSQRPVFLLMTVSLKIALMSITPLSPEFVAFTHVTTANDITYTLSSGSFMVWSLMLRLIYGFWLVLPVEHPSVWNTIGFSYYNSSPSINLLVFLLKTPLLVADIFMAPVIYKILTQLKVSKHRAQLGMKLWLLNPFATLIAEMGGAPDIVALLFVTVSVYALMRRRFTISSFMLILSSLIRMYSLFLIPIYFMIIRRELGNKESLRFILRCYAFPMAIAIALPILLANQAVVNGLIAGSPRYWFLLGPLVFPFYFAPDLPTALTVGFSFVLILAMWLGFWKASSQNAGDCIFIFLLSLFTFPYWNPNFLLWIIPFMILDYGLKKEGRIYLISFFIVALAYLLLGYSDYFASAGNSVFFIPNFNEAMTFVSTNLYSLQSIIWISRLSIITILRSMFAGICLAYALRLSLENLHQGSRTTTRGAKRQEKRLKESVALPG